MDTVGKIENSGQEQLQRWDYQTRFREYTLLLGRKGAEALEPINKYPERINLDTAWHGVLNRMRVETKTDGHERYTLISYDESARDFYFPEISVRGEPEEVPASVINEEIRKAQTERKITSIVGELHTHPIEVPFSELDLLRLINDKQAQRLFVAGVTTNRLNIFAFRTRETVPINKYFDLDKTNIEFFMAHWRKKAGYKLSNDGSIIIGGSVFANLWRMNLGIAEKHRLALYRGKPNEDLVRVHTEKTPLWIWSDLMREVLQG